MDDKKIRRRFPVDERNAMRYNRRSSSRSKSPEPGNSSNSYGRYRSGPRSRRERRTPERHTFRREHHDRRRFNAPENPEESRCLGVFGMHFNTGEEDLRDVFAQYGRIEEIKIVYDKKTNRSRGYSFIYYESIENAKEAKKHCNNLELHGKTIRVDFSLTNRAHSPTPGTYMGEFNDGWRDRRPQGDSSRYGTGYHRDSYQRNEGRTRSRYHSRSRSARR